MHFFFRNLKLPLHLNLGLAHVALSHMLPCFPILKLSLLQSLDTNISLIWSLILEVLSVEVFSAMNSAHHFLDIYLLDFYLNQIFLPSSSKKILWSNKFLKVLPYRNYFIWKSRWPLFIMRFWTLNLNYMTFLFL
jgi:hypothetical protein